MFYIRERKGKTWQQMIDKYTDVFRDKLGTMKLEFHIDVPESTPLRYFKPRPFAYALHGPVVSEIERVQVVPSFQ